MNLTRLLLLIPLALNPALSDELVLNHLSDQEISDLGFHPAVQLRPHADQFQFPAGIPLPWPITFPDAQHTIGNNMVQYQLYSAGGSPYYHGGCDLRGNAGDWITAPVSGRIEGFHYSYKTRADGSNQKYFQPWPANGAALYFEIAILDDQGYRYEIHHIDRATLTPEVLTALNAGGGRVNQGDRLGKIVRWPTGGIDGKLYHHIHYNVIDPSGVILNPEAVSDPVDDQTPPSIHHVFAELESGDVIEIQPSSNQDLDAPIKKLIVATTDKRNDNVYTHAPSRIALVGETTGFDFRTKLSLPGGNFPDIRKIYQNSLRTKDGRIFRTQGNYQDNFFLFQLDVPNNHRGPLTIEVEDTRGNQSHFTFFNRFLSR